MECKCPAAPYWREHLAPADDAYVSSQLRTAWMETRYRDPVADGTAYHDWTHYRAITLREARKRGLDLSVAGR